MMTTTMTVNVLATMVEPNNRRECLLAKIILAHHNTDNLHNWSYLIKIIHKCLKDMGPRQAQQLQQTDNIVQNVCDEDDSMAMMRMMVMMTMNEERVKAVRRLQQTDIDRCRPTECYSYTTPTLTIDGCNTIWFQHVQTALMCRQIQSIFCTYQTYDLYYKYFSSVCY